MVALINRRSRVVATHAVLLGAVAGVVVPALAQAAQPVPAGYPEFQKVWARTDYPVQQGVVQRSWLWGPGPNATLMEPNAESPGNMRQVQYYDKARMEVNDPRMDAASPWYVTNGLLVVEMISGRMQLGANTFEQRSPAQIPVAGDTIAANPGALAPTYASLEGIASLANDEHRAKSMIGVPVTATLSPDGSTGALPPVSAGLPRIEYYEKTTGHNVPDVFWKFMNARGLVYENGGYHEDKVFDWVYAMGYPITEPYWIDIRIKSKPVRVMVQAFQRRILTYNPANEQAWQVEMGNVGMQYYQWRYGTRGAPTPGVTPAPSPAPGGQALKLRRFSLPQPLDVRQYSGIEDPLYTVVTSQKVWEDLWGRHTATFEPKVTPPAVDWGREFVAAAFWGDKPNSCYHLDIESVSASGSALTVRANTLVKVGSCAQVITQPHDFAVVSSQELAPGKYKVEFKDASGVTLGETDASLP